MEYRKNIKTNKYCKNCTYIGREEQQQQNKSICTVDSEEEQTQNKQHKLHTN